mmetsp:Transcript_24684/g.28368  ORF Transcript_24684/g.28368 Transcript_24684/m.28368 type:complete len:122 (+) Transcript_24684:361-726(+)
MYELIKEYATQEFGEVIDQLNEEEWIVFRTTLYTILFSHRYKKNDDFLEGINFSLIRGVLYSYTTEARVELLSNPYFALAVAHFMKKGTEEFVRAKIRDKPKLYSDELQSELQALEDEAKG